VADLNDPPEGGGPEVGPPRLHRPEREGIPRVAALGYVGLLAGSVTLLLTHHLVGLGIALLVVEAFVATAITLARRPPRRRPDRPARLPGEPVLGLPGDRPPGLGSRTVLVIAGLLVGLVLLLGLLVAFLARAG